MPPKPRGPVSPGPKAKAGSPLGSPASKSAPARPKLGGLSPPAAKPRPSSLGRASISGPFSAGKAPAKAKGKAKGKAKAKAAPEDGASTQRLHDVPVRASTTVWETDTEDPASTMELPQVSDVDGLGSPDLRAADSGPESPHFMASGAASEMSAALQSSTDGGSPGQSPVLQEAPSPQQESKPAAAAVAAAAAPAAAPAAASAAPGTAGASGNSGRRASQSFFSDESGDETSAAGSPVSKTASAKPKASALTPTLPPAAEAQKSQEVAKSDASSPKSDSAPARETAVPNPTARVIKAAKAALLVQKLAGGFEKLGLAPGGKASSDSSDSDEKASKKKNKKRRAKFGKEDSDDDDDDDDSSDSLAAKEKQKEKEKERLKELEKQKARKDRDTRRASASSFWSDDSDHGSRSRSQSRSSRALSPPAPAAALAPGGEKKRGPSPRGSVSTIKDPPATKKEENPPKLELESMQATPGGESSLMSTSATLTGNGNGGPPTFGMPSTPAAAAPVPPVPAIVTPAPSPAGETAPSNGGMMSLSSLKPAGSETSRTAASPALSPRDKEGSEAIPVLSSIAKVASEERHALGAGMQPTPSKATIPEEEESPLLTAALQDNAPSEKSTSNSKEVKDISAVEMKEEGCETEISALQVEELLRAVPLLQELEGQQLLIQQGLTEALEYERRARAEEIARCEKLSVELGQALLEEKKRYEDQARERELELEEHFRHYEQQWRDQVRCLTEEVEQLRKEAQKAAAAREAAAQRDAEAAAAAEAAREATAKLAALEATPGGARELLLRGAGVSSGSGTAGALGGLAGGGSELQDSDIAAVYLRRRFYVVHSTRRAAALTRAVQSQQMTSAEAAGLLNGSNTDDIDIFLNDRRQKREQPAGGNSSSSSSSSPPKQKHNNSSSSSGGLPLAGLRPATAPPEESSPVGSTKSGRGVQFTDGAEIAKFRSDKPVAARREAKDRPSTLDQIETKRYLASRITSIADAVFNRQAKAPPPPPSSSARAATTTASTKPTAALPGFDDLELLSAPVQSKEVRRSQLVAQVSPSVQSVDTKVLELDSAWQSFRNADKVNHGEEHSDVEAMECRTEAELRAVKKRVEEKGYSGFVLVRNMACLKKVPGQLKPQDLVPTTHKCTFWLYTAPHKVAPSVRPVDTAALDTDVCWKPYRNMDKVNHGLEHSDVEAMECRNEVELQAVKARVEAMGYSGFSLVRNMACLKQVPGQLKPEELEPTTHNCTFWLYTPPTKAKGRWLELENMDKVEFSCSRSDVESMPCQNAEECAKAKRRVEEMGYSGFVVVGGTAFLKSAGKLKPSDLQSVPHRCVFYIYDPNEVSTPSSAGRRRGETAEEARARLRCGAPAEEEEPAMVRQRSSIEEAVIDKPSTGSSSPRSQVLKAEAEAPLEEEPGVRRTRSGRRVSLLVEGEAPMEAQRSLVEEAVIDKPSTGSTSPHSPAQARRSIEEAMVDSRSTGSRSGKRVSLFVDGEVSPKVHSVDVPGTEVVAITSQRSIPKVAIALASPSTGESAVVKPGEEELSLFDEPQGAITQSQRQAVKRRSRLEAEDRLWKIFRHCDKNQDGTINKRELIKIIRRRPDIAEFFGLPASVHQEDGTRDEVEQFFQSLDKDSNREISWEEFFAWYLRSGSSKQVPDSHRSKKDKSPAVRKGAEALIKGLKSGEVVELLSQFEAGKLPPPPAEGDKALSSPAWRKGTLYLKAGLLSGEVEKLLADYEAAEAKACKDKKNYDRSETWRKGAAILKEGLLSGEVDQLLKDFESQERKSEKKAKKEKKKAEQSDSFRKGAGALKKGLLTGEVNRLLKEYEEAETAAAKSKSKSERSVAFKKGAEVLKAGLLSGEVDKLIQEFEAAEEKAKKKGEQSETWRKGAQFLKAGLLTGEVDRLLQEFEASQSPNRTVAEKVMDESARTPSQPSKPGPSVPMIPIGDLVPFEAPFEESPQLGRAPQEGPSSEDLKAQYGSLKKAIASAFRRSKRETDTKRLRLDALKDLIDKGEPPAYRPSQSAHILLRKEDEEWRKASRLAKAQSLSREDLMAKYISLAEEMLKEAQTTAATSASPRSASASAASPRSVSPRSPREPPVTIPAPEEVMLGKFFGMADLNRDGSITIREMIKVVRQNPEVAQFFGLPQNVNDRDGSLDRVTSLFQSLDKDGNRNITWEEFRRWYATRPATPLEMDGDRKLTALPDVAPLPAEEMLGKIFGMCDQRGRGYINKPMLVEVTRTNPRIASFFGLTSNGAPSIQRLEGLFRELGQSGAAGDIGWSEFSGWFRQRQQQQKLLPSSSSSKTILPSPTALEVTAPLQLGNTTGNDDNSSVGTSPPADLLESFNAAASASPTSAGMGAVKSATYMPLPVPRNFSFASPGRRLDTSPSPSPSPSPSQQSPVGVVLVAPKLATSPSASPTRPAASGMPGTIVSPRAWTSPSGSPTPPAPPPTQVRAQPASATTRQASTIGSDLFGKLDTNKDGLLTKEELEQAFALMDVGRKGKVSKEEFKHFCNQAKKQTAPAQLQFRPVRALSPATAPADVAFPRSPMSTSSGNFVLPMPRRVVIPSTHQEAPSPVAFLRPPVVAGAGGMNRAASVGTLGQRTATSPLVTPMAYRFSPTFPGRA